MITDILTAIRFLTVLPVGRAEKADPARMASAMSYFPLVGLMLGLFLAGVDYLLMGHIPRQVLDVVLVGLLALITGGLHLDGLADTIDGIIGGRGDRARTLEIMKDSRIGAMGVVGLVLLLLFKFAALEGMATQVRTAALVVMPTLSRWSQVQMTLRSKAARSEGSLARSFVELLRPRHFIIATVISIAVASYAGVRGAAAFGAVLAFTLAARAYFHRLIGGVTGDTIGASSELSEALVLMVFVIGV